METRVPTDVKVFDTTVTHCKVLRHAYQRQLSTTITTQLVTNGSSNDAVVPTTGAVLHLLFTIADPLFYMTDHPFPTPKSMFLPFFIR